MADFVVDSFTDTAGTDLLAHVGEAATWARFSGSSNAVTYQVNAANRLMVAGTGGSATPRLASPAASQADYTVAVDIYAASHVSGFAGGVIARTTGTSASSNYYRFYLENLSTTAAYKLEKIVGGVGTNLWTSTSSAGNRPPLGGSARLALTLSGSTLTMYRDGTLLNTVVDGSLTAAGQVGIYYGSGSPVTVATDTTGWHLDNLAASLPAAVGGAQTLGLTSGTATGQRQGAASGFVIGAGSSIALSIATSTATGYRASRGDPITLGLVPGTAQAQRAAWSFTPPSEPTYHPMVPVPATRFLMAQPRGLTVYRLAGQWLIARSPEPTDLAVADRVYLGGYVHPLSADQLAELQAAGFGAYVSLEAQ